MRAFDKTITDYILFPVHIKQSIMTNRNRFKSLKFPKTHSTAGFFLQSENAQAYNIDISVHAHHTVVFS